MSNTIEDRKLFHLMAERMYEMAFEGKPVEPDLEDLSMVLWAISGIAYKRHDKESRIATAALDFVGGEWCNDLGYEVNERADLIDMLLETLVDCNELERLNGKNNTAYLRK